MALAAMRAPNALLELLSGCALAEAMDACRGASLGAAPLRARAGLLMLEGSLTAVHAVSSACGCDT